MKKIINSPYMTWFRKSFLNRIHKEISTDKEMYCCLVKSWHSWFICWKDLKEVNENLTSKQIIQFLRTYGYELNCTKIWFDSKTERLAFLQECIDKCK